MILRISLDLVITKNLEKQNLNVLLVRNLVSGYPTKCWSQSAIGSIK